MDTYPSHIGNQLTCLTDKELQRVLLQYQERAGFSSTKEMLLHLKEVALCSHFDYLGQVGESKGDCGTFQWKCRDDSCYKGVVTRSDKTA